MKFWLSLLVILGLAAGGAYWWWLPRQSTGTDPIYRVAVVRRSEIVQSVTATGQLSPLKTVEVGSQVSGTLAAIHVDFNDAVKTGQLLAEIDPGTYLARVVQAEAQVDSARANLELKRLTAERSAELRKSEIVAQSNYDQALAELRQQEASVRIAEASLQNVKLDLNRTNIYAPIDGVVISRDVDVGQTVQASFSAPKLFSIAQDLRQMEISAAVSEADIGAVVSGQPVSFTVDAYPERTFNGSVRQVRANSIITQNVVTYSTIITVTNDDLKLLPGMTANVVINTARRPNAVVVSNAALRFRPPENARIRAPEAEASAPAAADELSIDKVPGLEQMPEEFRQRMFDRYDADKNGRLNPAELAALQEARARFAAGGGGPGGGQGGRGPGGGGGRAARSAPDVTRTVHVLATPPAANAPAQGELIAKTVRIGITDGVNTEIISGLNDGEVIVLGVVDPTVAASPGAQETRNPFSPQMPGRGNRR